jgi:hypothetical protein
MAVTTRSAVSPAFRATTQVLALCVDCLDHAIRVENHQVAGIALHRMLFVFRGFKQSAWEAASFQEIRLPFLDRQLSELRASAPKCASTD